MEFAAEPEGKFQETRQDLNSLGSADMSKLQESEVRLSGQICNLQMIATELERERGGSAVAVLQDARYYLGGIDGSQLLRCLEPARITEPRLCQIPGVNKMMEVLHIAFHQIEDTALCSRTYSFGFQISSSVSCLS